MDTHHVIGAGLRCMEASHQKEAFKPHCKDKPYPDGRVTHTSLVSREFTH